MATEQKIELCRVYNNSDIESLDGKEIKHMRELVIKLSKALDKAKANGDKVLFNVYDEWDRKDGRPHIRSFNLDEWEISTEEDYKEWMENDPEISDFLLCPNFEGDGCTDLVIVDNDNNYFYVYYHDNYEDTIYEDELKTYLQ